jgi:hypothetical protein
MIGYLEQLERDLVEAVDRRETARARRWPRRPTWMPLVTAVVAVLVIAVVVAVARPGSTEEHAVGPPPVGKKEQQPSLIPPGTPLRLVGEVTRIDPTTWRGQARGPGGVGTLTITGTVNLTARPCCDTPQRRAPDTSHTIHWTWTGASGTVRGRVRNTVYRRPHGRFVWDGLGRVTSAAGALRRYRGRELGIAGETRTSTPDRARIIL